MWLFRLLNRHAILCEADEIMEAFGNEAYAEARKRMRTARELKDSRGEKLYSAVAQEVAKRTHIEIGVDPATRYLEKQEPYDHGPGVVIERSKNTTLH